MYIFCFCVSGYPSTIEPPVDAQDEAMSRYGLTPRLEVVNEPLQVGGVNGCSQETPTSIATSCVSGIESCDQHSRVTNGKGISTFFVYIMERFVGTWLVH